MAKFVKKTLMELITTPQKVNYMKTSDCRAERLQFVIGRFDHYYESVNTKTALLLTLATLLPSLLFSLNHSIDNFLSVVINSISIFISVAIYWSLLVASQPYLKSNNESLLFFGSISKKDIESYRSAIKTETEDSYLDDLIFQAYSLSKGLSKKYKYIQIATWLIIIQVVFIALYTIITQLS